MSDETIEDGNGPTGERRLLKQGHYSRLVPLNYLSQRSTA